jgi:hypothetical protein
MKQERKYTKSEVTELLRKQIQACVIQKQSGKLVSWTELIEVK